MTHAISSSRSQTATRLVRRRLMAGGAIIAAAMSAMVPSAGLAQSADGFVGTGTVVAGSADLSAHSTTGRVTITAPQTVINWRPSDFGTTGTIDFLPINRQVNFVGTQPYTVLNRILPDNGNLVPVNRLIAINGTITSRVGPVGTTQPPIGGSVWLYSPAGILLGNSAVINVGNLVLTSNDIDTSGGLFGPGGEIRFRGSATSGPVAISPGAVINASDPTRPGGSYVALVAPLVVHTGTINVAGSAALVGAEQVNITINNGLFDIDVLVGTDSPFGIFHAGTTGGPADSSGTYDSRAYFVAIPKNAAMTMLLRGTVGFGGMTAMAQDGAIVISAGRDILNGDVIDVSVNGDPLGNVQISDFAARNDMTAVASGAITISSNAAGCNNCAIFDVNGNANLISDTAVTITAGRGQRVQVGGDLNATATSNGIGGTVNVSANLDGPGAGNALLDPGAIQVGGTMRLSAFGRGVGGNALDGAGQGGTVTATATGGSISATAIVLDAGASGDFLDVGDGAAGTGGTAILTADANGSITARQIDVSANGAGGGARFVTAGIEEPGPTGGAGIGGTAIVRAAGAGSITVDVGSPFSGFINVSASGAGGAGFVSDGSGSGGRAAIEVADAASSISALGADVRATGFGGANGPRNYFGTAITGGNGIGGLAELVLNGGFTANFVQVSANAGGSNAEPNPQFPNAPSPRGGNATGGTARVTVNGTSPSIIDLSITSSATAGEAISATGVGGNAVGGNSRLILNGASVFAPLSLTMASRGLGGAGVGTSGNGRGGNVVIDLTSSAARLTLTDVILIASGVGGSARDTDAGTFLTADGGDGAGGLVQINSAGLVEVRGGLTLDASGSGGSALPSGDPRAPQTGNATGGTAQLNATGGTIRANGIFLNATGSGNGSGQLSGNATGGTASLNANGGGLIESTGVIALFADADAGAGATAGNAFGGNAQVDVAGGRIATVGGGGLSVTANATGATGSGGQIRLSAIGGSGTQVIDVGITNLGANGPNAGRIELIESNAGAGIVLGRLDARTTGIAASPLSGITFQSSNGAMTVAGEIELLTTGSDIRFVADGTGGINAGSFVFARSGGNITGTHSAAAGPTLRGSRIDLGATGAITFNPGTLVLGNTSVLIRAGLGLTMDRVQSTGSTVDLFGDSIAVTNAQAATTLTLTATGNASLGNGLSGGNTSINAANIQVGTARSTGAAADILLTTTGTTTLGTLNAARNVSINTGTLAGATSAITAAQRVDMTTTGNALFGSMTGGTGIAITSGGAVNGNGVTATGAGSALTVAGATGVTLATVNSGGTAQLASSGGVISVGTVDAVGAATLNAATGINATRVTSSGGAVLLTSAGNITVDTANAATTLTMTSPGNVNLRSGTSGGNLRLDGQFVSATTLTTTGAGSDILINAATGGFSNINLAPPMVLNSAGDIVITAGFINTGVGSSMTAADIVNIGATVFATLGTVIGADGVTINSGGGVSAVAVQTTTPGAAVSVTGAAPVNITTLASSGAATVRSTGDSVSIGNGTAAGAFTVTAATDVTSSNLTSTGGAVQVNAANINVGTLRAATTVSLIGTGLVVLSDSLSGGSTTISGRNLQIGAVQTTAAASDITITATQNADISSLLAPRDVIVTVGSLNAPRLALTAGRNVVISSGGAGEFLRITAGNAVTFDSTGNVTGFRVQAGGAVQLSTQASLAINQVESTGGNINVTAALDLNILDPIAAGTMTMTAGRDLVVNGAVSGGTMRMQGRNIQLVNGRTTGPNGDIVLVATGDVDAFTLNSARDILITGGALIRDFSVFNAARTINAAVSGTALFNTATAGTNVSITAGGSIGGNRVQAGSGGVVLNGSTGVTIDAIQSAGTTTLNANNGKVVINMLQSTGVVIATGQGVNISSGAGGLDFTTLQATAGDAIVNATTGNLIVRNGSATGALTLTTQAGNLDTGTLNGGAITLTSSGTATLGGATTATGALNVTSTRATTVNAVATGTSVQVRSGDIVVGTNGRLGTAGTTTALTLSNTDTSSRTFIGGGDIATGYSLSAAEMRRLFGTNITINAPRAQTQGGGSVGSTRPPDVLIGPFTLQGGATAQGNLGAGGALTINTAGSARVNGAVVLDGMGATNSFILNATEALEVISGLGSIRLINGGALSGILDLRSDDVAVATSAAITAIAGLTDIAAINDRLGQSDGAQSNEGALAANTIRITARVGVYIQNTGTSDRFADRRGFTTGTGGLSITSGNATGPARIVINGQIPNAAGVLTTGRDTIPLLTINGVTNAATGFAAGSTVNGCQIGNVAACLDFENDSVPPLQDVVTGAVGDGDPESPFALLIEIRENERLPNEPLIDDPVTGTGNDDLWDPAASECEGAENGEACPAPAGG